MCLRRGYLLLLMLPSCTYEVRCLGHKQPLSECSSNGIRLSLAPPASMVERQPPHAACLMLGQLIGNRLPTKQSLWSLVTGLPYIVLLL